jgi:tetratricopeptide (TPR) repeat protein
VADLDIAIRLNGKEGRYYEGRGIYSMYLKDYNGSVADYEVALSMVPAEFKQSLMKNMEMAKHELFIAEAAHYEERLRLNTITADTYIGMGITKAKQHNYQGAIADYDRAIQLEPANAYAYHYRGVAKFLCGFIPNGCGDFRKALEYGYGSAQEDLKKYCK